MSTGLKRFFYYWRWPLYLLALAIIFFILGMCFEGNVSTTFGVLWLFACVFFIMALFCSIFNRIKALIEYLRTGVKEEYYDFPEIDFFEDIAYKISDDFEVFGELSLKNKLRFLGFRTLGTILVIGGCIGCFFFSFSLFMIVVFTLVIIGGVTLWILSNPNRYNSQVAGTRMVACHDGHTDERIYEYLKGMPTSLGTPVFADVFGFDKPVIVYGSNYDDYVYVVYRSTHSENFFISAIAQVLVRSELPVQKDDDPYHSTSTVQDFGYYLDELEDTVETAIRRAVI